MQDNALLQACMSGNVVAVSLLLRAEKEGKERGGGGVHASGGGGFRELAVLVSVNRALIAL